MIKIEKVEFSSYPEKVKTLLFDTRSFMDSIAKEKEYWPIVFFYVAVTGISYVASTVLSFPLLLLGLEGALAFAVSLIFLPFNVMLCFTTPFIGAGMTHLGVLIMGGKEEFFNTFKPVSYSMAIMSVYSIIPIALSSLFNLSETIPAINMIAIPALIIMMSFLLFGIVHSMYAQIIGLKKYQKLSTAKAVIAIVLIPLILTIVILVFILLIALFIGGGLAMLSGALPQ